MYRKFFKRILDFCLSLLALIVLSPILLILTIIGIFAMGGNPFFAQSRPGKKGKNGEEKIVNLKKGKLSLELPATDAAFVIPLKAK